MTPHHFAKRLYGQSATPIRTTRGNEYEILARITHRLRQAAQHNKSGFSILAQAVHDNRQLWTLLAADVADNDNKLPQDLRARVFYLAEFTRQYSGKVLRDHASVLPLLEINMAIMRGLNPARTAA